MNLNFIIKTPIKSLVIQSLRLLSESLIYNIDPEPSHEVKESCANFLVRVSDNMQPFYKNALTMVIIYLNVFVFLKYKKRLTNLSLREISDILKKWQTSKLAYKRDFIKLVFNLNLIAYYDNKEVMNKFGIDRSAYLRGLSFYR